MIQKLVVILFLSVLTFALLGTAQGVEDTILKPHAPIYINGNSDFTAENGVVSGSGTEGDPYIIEGWEIAEGDFGISIGNSDTYFIIRKCEIKHIIKWSGMSFHNVHNGRIESCIVEDVLAQNAIVLHDSYRNVLANNVVKDSYLDAIALFTSNSNALLENTVDSDSSWQWAHAIKLYGSSHNLLYKNTAELTRFGIEVRDLDGQGVFSIGNKLVENTVCGNKVDGIRLLHAQDTVILANTVCENGEVGIRIYESSGSTIYRNNLTNNELNASDTAITDNQWDNGTEGNYWSDFSGWDANGDGISDSPHKIESGGVDRYPLMRPWK